MSTRVSTLVRLLPLLACLPLLASCDSSASATPAQAQAPASIADAARDPQQSNDFLRLVFLPAGVEPSDRLGAPSAVRVFSGASAMFDPPLSLEEVADFFGIFPAADRELVAMRCSPRQRTALDARLATWPEAIAVIQEDLGARYTCPPQPGSAENEVYCLAASFVDEPRVVAAQALSAALTVGAQIFADAGRAEVLRRRYGIFPAFTGLGYAGKGSSSGAPSTANDTLRESVVPEYLLINATLADAGCSCIRVAPYDGREQAPLSIGFIDRQGGYGECTRVSRLEK